MLNKIIDTVIFCYIIIKRILIDAKPNVSIIEVDLTIIIKSGETIFFVIWPILNIYHNRKSFQHFKLYIKQSLV